VNKLINSALYRGTSLHGLLRRKKALLATTSPCLIIFISLFIAFLPVILSDNYLRQDDLMWELWPHMKMSDFGVIYYNAVYQLVRPISMLSLYITDMLSMDIHHAVYIRLFNIVMLGLLGIFLYRWQLLFNSNRLVAAVFAITAFTLQPYLIFISTGNYTLIINALLLTFIAMFFWHRSYQSGRLSRYYYALGCIFFFMSLLEYPLSSMYAWALLTIYYLNHLMPNQRHHISHQFTFFISRTVIGLMISYYIFSRLFQKILHVNMHTHRATVIDTSHIASHFMHIFDILIYHSQLWLWAIYPSSTTPLILLTAVFVFALYKMKPLNPIYFMVTTIAVVFLFFFLSYSPILASSEFGSTPFRYALITMPILLYVFCWSMQTILTAYTSRFFATFRIIFFSSLTLFAISYSNLMLADNIVGPHDQDFTAIQTQLREQVLPLLAQHKRVLIHAIDCANGSEETPVHLEYDMRICQFQQQVISVIIHSLNKFGIASNDNNHNDILWNNKEIVVRNTPWGTLVAHSGESSNNDLNPYLDKNMVVVTVDTRLLAKYQKYGFYKKMLQKQ